MQRLLLIALLLALAGCAGTGQPPAEGGAARPSLPSFRILSRSAPPPEAPANDEARILAAVNDENSIFFAAGDTDVNAEGRAKLQRHAQRLKADDKLVAMLIGQTNDQGSGAYNLAVSEQRAEAVYKALRSLGVPATQLRRYGVGGEKVSAACRSPECLRKMRRVEIRYE